MNQLTAIYVVAHETMSTKPIKGLSITRMAEFELQFENIQALFNEDINTIKKKYSTTNQAGEIIIDEIKAEFEIGVLQNTKEFEIELNDKVYELVREYFITNENFKWVSGLDKDGNPVVTLIPAKLVASIFKKLDFVPIE